MPKALRLQVKKRDHGTLEAAAIKIQRRFRYVKYRLDRQLLIERIRLESKLRILMARLVYTLVILFLVCYNLSSSAVHENIDLLQQVQNGISAKLGLSSLINSPYYYSWEYYNTLFTTMSTTLTTDTGLSSAGSLPDTYVVGKLVVTQSRSTANLCSSFATSLLRTAASNICPTCSDTSTICSVALGDSVSSKTTFLSETTLDALTTGFSVNGVFFTPSGFITILQISVATLTSVPTVTYVQSPAYSSITTANAVTAWLVILLTIAWIFRDVLTSCLEFYHRYKDSRFRLKMKALGGVLNSGWGLGFWYLSNLLSHFLAFSLMVGRLSTETVSASYFSSLLQSLSSAATTASGSATAIASVAIPLSSEQSWDKLGLVSVVFLLIMIVECLAGHPKVGILTETWLLGADEMLHFLLTFLVFYLSLGVIGWVGFGSELSAFRTYSSTLSFQFEMLTSGTWMSRVDPTVQGGGMLMLYLLVFTAIVSIILVNFFTAILIESYMSVRETVAHSSYYQSFPSDVIATFKSEILIRMGRLPQRPDLVSGLMQVFAKRSVDLAVLKNTGLFKRQSDLFLFFQRYRKIEALNPKNLGLGGEPWQAVSAHAHLLAENGLKSNLLASSAAVDTLSRLAQLKAKLEKLSKFS